MPVYADTNSEYYYRVTSTTKNPTLAPKPYRLVRKSRTSVQFSGWKGVDGSLTEDSFPRSKCRSWSGLSPSVTAMNNALAKFKQSLGDKASLQADFHERQGTIDMFVGNGAKELLKFSSAMVRRDKKALMAYAKTYRDRKRLDKASDIPSAWLAVQFGIMPTVQSLQDTIRTLTQSPYDRVAGGASIEPHNVRILNEGKGPAISSLIEQNGEVIVKYGGVITNVNGNLLLAQDLGLLNPLSSLAEVVPWSWFVDYMVNATDMISNCEPFFPAGTLGGVYRTIFYKGDYSYKEWRNGSVYQRPIGDGKYEAENADYTFNTSGKIVEMTRTINPQLNFKLETNPNGLNVRQFSYAMSAIALTLKGK